MVRGEAKEVNLIPRAFHRREFESPRLSTVSEFIVVAVGSGCPIRQPVASGVPDRVFDGLGRGGELHDFVPPPPPPPPRTYTKVHAPRRTASTTGGGIRRRCGTVSIPACAGERKERN